MRKNHVDKIKMLIDVSESEVFPEPRETIGSWTQKIPLNS